MKKLMMSAAAFAMALGVAAASADAEAKTKACWVYVGSIGDFGWTYEHNQGRLAVEKELEPILAKLYASPRKAG